MSEFNKAISDCALECSLRRRNRHCYQRFGDAECLNCDFYVANYVNADPRHVRLFMMQSDMEAERVEMPARHDLFTFMLGLVVVAILFSIIKWGDYQNTLNRQRLLEQYVTSQAPEATVQRDPIARTMRDIRIRDTNNDGLKNCIDWAVLFYKNYPNEVCIMLNRNPATGMNHLFNCVKIDGVWRAIEPQAYKMGYSSYWMRDVWGSKYDSSINKDVIADYLKYAK